MPIDGEHPEVKNSKALAVIERVKNKLTGEHDGSNPSETA
jgi:hypothetical protein